MDLLSFMRRFSIRLRMLGAIGVVMALLFVVGGAGLWGMHRLASLGSEFAGHAFVETQTLSRMRVALVDMSRHEKDMVIQYESPEQMSLARVRWERSLGQMRQEMSNLLDGEDDPDNALVRAMGDRLQTYVAAV
ncbi:MCP four helix bundle domain-containing protein, partial [Arthrospira platensis SPKY1]|nr:MCP four helix bundle domain-containing protein [Arthrospira platensis SPKY1]